MPPRKVKDTETPPPKVTKAPPKVKASKKEPKKSKKKVNSDSEGDGEVVEDDKVDIDWSTDLSHALLTAITDDLEIKQGLFPPPGANPRTGGKTKSTYHWALCVLLFEKHEKYHEPFLRLTTPKQKQTWANKVKNRIKRMIEITNKYINEMGETGAGITREDQIDMSQVNTFTTKWEIIKKACPWFFEMRELIAEHPNTVPAGIGNSETEIDMSVLTTQTASEPTNSGYASEEWDLEDFGGTSGGVDVVDLDESDESDVEDADVVGSTKKRKAPNKIEMADSSLGKTGARPGISNPVSRTPKNPVKKQKKDEFAEIAQAEEVTRQKELELMKARAVKDTVKAKAKLAKLELEKEKLADAREKRRAKMEARAMQMQFMGGRNQGFGTTNFAMHNTFPSNSFTSAPGIPGSSRMPGPTSLLTSSSNFIPSTGYYHGALPSYPSDNIHSGSPISGTFTSSSSRNSPELFALANKQREGPFADGTQSPGDSYRLPGVPDSEE